MVMSSSYWIAISVIQSLYLCVCGEAIPLKSILDIQIQFWWMQEEKNAPLSFSLLKMTIFATESEGEILGSEGNLACPAYEIWKIW